MIFRPINNPAMASKGSSKSKNHTSLTLYQKQEMTKLSEEGMSKAKIGQSEASCSGSQAVNKKEKFSKKLRMLLQ